MDCFASPTKTKEPLPLEVIERIEIVKGPCIETLKNPTASKEDKAFYLKLLVHFIGDIHQPR